MLRVPISKAWIKRTIKPLYGWTQQTPQDVKLDPAWDRSVDIYPGMVAMKTTGDNVTLINATGIPYGLWAEYIGGDGIDEPLDSGVNSTAVWVFGPDAQSQILDPAFDSGASWTDPGDGTIVLLHAYTDGVRRGKLAPAGTTGRGTLSGKPVCRLIKVDSAKMITVGGLHAIDIPTWN